MTTFIIRDGLTHKRVEHVSFPRNSAAVAWLIDLATNEQQPFSQIDTGVYMIGDPKDGIARTYEIHKIVLAR